MLIVGDAGAILCDFRGNAPRLIPSSATRRSRDRLPCRNSTATNPDDEWINAIKRGEKSRGSFEEVAALAEAVTLANIALRVPYKRLLWDSARMEFTNSRRGQQVRASRGVPDRLGHAHRIAIVRALERAHLCVAISA